MTEQKTNEVPPQSRGDVLVTAGTNTYNTEVSVHYSVS